MLAEHPLADQLRRRGLVSFARSFDVFLCDPPDTVERYIALSESFIVLSFIFFLIALSVYFIFYILSFYIASFCRLLRGVLWILEYFSDFPFSFCLRLIAFFRFLAHSFCVLILDLPHSLYQPSTHAATRCGSRAPPSPSTRPRPPCTFRRHASRRPRTSGCSSNACFSRRASSCRVRSETMGRRESEAVVEIASKTI